MLTVYKLIEKDSLLRYIHVFQHVFIPQSQIPYNMEYIKIYKYDVLIMRIDNEKTFNTILWDFVEVTMVS